MKDYFDFIWIMEYGIMDYIWNVTHIWKTYINIILNGKITYKISSRY